MTKRLTFENWVQGNQPWLLDEPPGDAGKRAVSVARNAWTAATMETHEQCAQVCRNAAQAYETRGQHSGIGWQVTVYLEREIRAIGLAHQREAIARTTCFDQALGDVGRGETSEIPHPTIRGALQALQDLEDFDRMDNLKEARAFLALKDFIENRRVWRDC